MAEDRQSHAKCESQEASGQCVADFDGRWTILVVTRQERMHWQEKLAVHGYFNFDGLTAKQGALAAGNSFNMSSFLCAFAGGLAAGMY